jgi:hypothetical protein
MDDLIDMIAAGDSQSQVSDRIKDLLFAKSAERIDAVRPYAAANLFGEEDSESYEDDESDEGDDEDEDDEDEYEDEYEDEED